MSGSSPGRGEGHAATRGWSLVLGLGASCVLFVGVAIADHRLRLPYPTLDLNAEWGDGLLDAAAKAPPVICGTSLHEADLIAPKTTPRVIPPPRPPPPTLSAQAKIGWMIQRRLTDALPETRGCYQAARRARPDLNGAWSFRFTILPPGTTADVVVTGDTQQDASLEGCLAELAQDWTFQAIDRPQPVTFTLPFGPAAERPALPTLSDPDEIQRMITDTLARRERPFRRCYEHAEQEAPDEVGPRTLTFVVQPDGTPSDLTLSGETMGEGFFEGCLIRVARDLRFQPVHKVQTVIVRLPLDDVE